MERWSSNRPPNRENYAVTRTKGLYASRRGTRVLVVEPSSASWAVIPDRQYAILEQLGDPLFFQELLERNPSYDEPSLHRLLNNFHEHGMIELNWKRFFPAEASMWKPLDRGMYPRDFYLHTTDACNFRCTYCYAAAETRGRTMTLETLKAIIERIFREIPHETVGLVFHGGEPLLLKKTLFAAMDWAQKRAPLYNKRVFYNIQTNGALIDDDVVEYSRQYGLDIGVTLDGPPEIHDLHRVYPDGRGTFADVWNPSQRAQAAGAHLGYLCIVHTPENYLKSYQFFVSRGIFSFNLRYSFAVGRAAENFEFNLEKGAAMARGLLDVVDAAVMFYRRTGIKIVMNDLDVMIRMLTSRRRNYMCMRSPCGIGRSIIAFGPDGEMYPCEEMSPYRHLSCGSIADRRPLTEILDSSEELQRLRERRVEAIGKCSVCPWRRFCMGRCTHKTLHYFGDHMREDPSCTFFSTLFEELMWRVNDDKTVLALG